MADAKACLGERNVIVIGDSVSHYSTFFDLCRKLGDHVPPYLRPSRQMSPLSNCLDYYALIATAEHTVNDGGALGAMRRIAKYWLNYTSGVPNLRRVTYVPNHRPVGRGLANMVGDGETIKSWEAFLSGLRHLNCSTVVIINSGLHDIMPPLELMKDTPKVAPLLLYRLHLRRLAWLLKRVQRADPRIRFVWKATTHARPLDGTNLTACWRRTTSSQTYAEVVSRLNAIAEEQLGAAGIPVWADPGPMTLSAQYAWYRDNVHHDAATSGKSFEVFRGPRNVFGPEGFSQQITQSFFRWFGCECSG